TADGAYDGAPTYQIVEKRSKDITVVIPPPVTAVLSNEAEQAPSQRDGHLISIATNGRLGWQKKTGYGRRSLAETAMGRYKAIIGPRLRARSLDGQRTEAAIGVAALNRMLAVGRPKSVRRMGKRS
ncbi:MAG: IS5/IS1182 family transposase, partial [Amphritea sp.]